MRKAGEQAFELFAALWPQLRSPAVFCGPGNNGGDGYVFARAAKRSSLAPAVIMLQEPSTPDAIRARQEYLDSGGHCVDAESAESGDIERDSVVDAIFGIGLKRPPQGKWLAAIESINSAPLPVLSLDVPSGLDADTGMALEVAVKADHTITFICRKLGLVTGQGKEFCGGLTVASLDVPDSAFDHAGAIGRIVNEAELSAIMPKRSADAHKGSAGRVTIVGGNSTMEGAALMSALACYRAGAGLVSVAMPSRNAAMLTCPEARIFGIEDHVSYRESVPEADVVAIGPGLGTDSWAQDLWSALKTSDVPMIVDADALNLLAQEPSARNDWVLTPHPGEAARLLQASTSDVQADRRAAASEIASRYGGVCVLKGSGSLIVSSERLRVCDRGNSGMATGGMGDILTGVISALRAQGMSAFDAAQAGVWMHARAGDASAERCGPIGMMATDLLPEIRSVVNELAHGS